MTLLQVAAAYVPRFTDRWQQQLDHKVNMMVRLQHTMPQSKVFRTATGLGGNQKLISIFHMPDVHFSELQWINQSFNHCLHLRCLPLAKLYSFRSFRRFSEHSVLGVAIGNFEESLGNPFTQMLKRKLDHPEDEKDPYAMIWYSTPIMNM